MTEGERLASAAARFIGVRFRLHGRTPEQGLDCIGLLAASLGAIGKPCAAPKGYGLRNTHIDQWLGLAARSGLVRTDGPILTGDVILMRPGPNQHHILIAENAAHFIHAHAGLRRVVRQPFPAFDTVSAQWRVIP